MSFMTGAVMKFTVFCVFMHGINNILRIKNSITYDSFQYAFKYRSNSDKISDAILPKLVFSDALDLNL